MSIQQIFENARQDLPIVEEHHPVISVVSSSEVERRRQRQAKRAYSFKLQDIAGDLLGPSWPVATCLKRMTDTRVIFEQYDAEHVRHGHVATCKSAWTCPICARRIFTRRKLEIERALKLAAEKGWVSLFLTVTIRHNPGSRLEELLKAMIAAWRSVFSGDRTGERACLKRVRGQIKTLEPRYGAQGHHPHFHILIAVDESGLTVTEKGLLEDEIAAVIWSRYSRKVKALGMDALPEAYNVRSVSIAGAAASYVTKLESSLSLEMTEGESKDSKSEARSYSMFQLLSAYERGTRQIYGHDIQALYREYAQATKGKRQISFSREMRALVDIKADEEIQEEPAQRVLAEIEYPLWRWLIEKRLRSASLDIAEKAVRENNLMLLAEWLCERERERIEALPEYSPLIILESLRRFAPLVSAPAPPESALVDW